MLSSVDVKFIFDSARLGLFSPANILQISDVALRALLALFTDPEEKKWKKEVFVNKKRHLVRTLFTIYKHPGDFFKGIFTILLQIQHENNFLPTSKHR